MRYYLLIAIVMGTLGNPFLAWAAEDYPYTAYVTVERTNIHSGPSKRFYPTDELFIGDEVEVYRREGTSWLGVRPPQGSFSWVPADCVEETDDEGVFRVLIETQSWIGTLFPSVKEHKYQVKLRPGELIEVTGQKTVQTAEGNETWLKIAPPAGEFRWIHTSQVSRTPPRAEELAASPRLPTRRELPEVQAAIGTGVNRAKDSLAALTAASSAIERPVKPVQHEIVLTDLAPVVQETKADRDEMRLVQHQQAIELTRENAVSPDGFVPRKPRRIDNTAGVPAPSTELRMASSERLQNSIHDKPRSSSLPAAAPTRTLAPLPVARASVARDAGATFDAASATQQLTELDLELSLRVAQPRSTWNLEPIRAQVQKIVDGGQSPNERGQARLLLEKIRKFEETFDLPNDPLIAAARGGPASPADARYDGVGILQVVVSRAGQASIAPYAIVDADGNPVAFVSPGPGMNLRRYENKPVGIYGKRGMVEAIRKPHLIAERVIDLSTR
ncbi:hypothetical protein NA78x_005297 [Anatilimnocola sp. NA78]|uniref:hypothetical protein n=1 Tax=Anatilimnocola sp. NA78 TaxID=3415683 RepID=UPI003CE580F0